MWIFTNFGFFSVVQKPGEEVLTVRSRVKEDLENLVAKYLPDATDIEHSTFTDYAYRVRVSRESFAEAMKSVASDIDYSNFKNSVMDKQGLDRELVYARVWGVVNTLQTD